MARPLWKGSISFGLVNIPVSLVTATSSEEIHFRLLDRRDFTPIRYQRVNEKTGVEVPWEDVVKGYEHEKGDYVVLTDADFKRANVEATQSVEIVDFVDRNEVEPVYYETPYYLEPLKPGRKGYALLREALRRSGRVGIAKVVIRSKQHLAMVTTLDDRIVLEILRYAHELRDPKALEVPGAKLEKEGVSEKEVELAERLIEGMSSRWQPEKYKDDYRDDLLALIEKKVASGDSRSIDETEPEAKKPSGGKVVDLMPLLERSLAAAGKGPARATRGAARKATPVRHHPPAKKSA